MLHRALLDGAMNAADALFAQLATVLPAAVAVVAFTVGIRLLLSPLSFAQLRGQRASAALAPRLVELRRRHAANPSRIVSETAALYRAERGGPLRGCLPGLAQAPFLLVTYRLFNAPTFGTQATHTMAGVPLRMRCGAALAAGLGSAPSLIFLGLFVALGLLAWWNGRALGAAGQAGRLVRVLPFGTVVVAAFVPLAVGLYLLTSTAWGALERVVYGRLLDRRHRRRVEAEESSE